MATTKVTRRTKIKKRIRGTIKGDAKAPRLSVFRSNKQIYAQLIDDISGKTLAYAGSIEKEFSGKKMPKSEQAKLIGKAIAERAVKAGIKTCSVRSQRIPVPRPREITCRWRTRRRIEILITLLLRLLRTQRIKN